MKKEDLENIESMLNELTQHLSRICEAADSNYQKEQKPTIIRECEIQFVDDAVIPFYEIELFDEYVRCDMDDNIIIYPLQAIRMIKQKKKETPTFEV